jgi:hypothetical protein
MKWPWLACVSHSSTIAIIGSFLCLFPAASGITRRAAIEARFPVKMGLQMGVGWVGLEPTTNALKGRCSTIELPTRRVISFTSPEIVGNQR